MDDLTGFIFTGTPFSEQEMENASNNYNNQVDLIEELHAAFILSGFTLEYMAYELGVDKIMVEEALTGQRDLTFTELRHLANALHVSVGYVVIKP